MFKKKNFYTDIDFNTLLIKIELKSILLNIYGFILFDK
jgi:hypothetical protein